MYVCNTGLDCEDCIGGCEQSLEWEDGVPEWHHDVNDAERKED